MNTSHARIILSIAAIIFGVATAQAADQQSDYGKNEVKPAKTAEPPRQQPDFSKVEIKTTKLADDFYTLEGQGGTISVLTGPDGILLVDSQFAPLTEKLVAAIKKISDKPIRFLVNTHVHGDHTGGNENFAKLGATLFSRDQLRARLAHPSPAPDGTPGKPAPAVALPVVTYDDPVTLHLDGEDVLLLPIRKAHTDGDTLVSFPNHNILAVGDYFRSTGYPVVDLNNGGSLAGILDGLKATIDRADANTRIIPGHGPITDRNGLIAQRDLILAVRDKVAALVAKNKPIEEVIAAKPTEDFDARVPQSAQTSERFIKWLYAEVKAGH
jgi:glyoxylase-like metal-dependent hydrolase (beta-lactamase superfamily II)